MMQHPAGLRTLTPPPPSPRTRELSQDKWTIAALATVLAGKTPEAIFDALHARRWLSARALQHPNELTETIKEYLRPSRSQPRTRCQLERLAARLISSHLINTDSPTLLHEETQ